MGNLVTNVWAESDYDQFCSNRGYLKVIQQPSRSRKYKNL